MRPAPPALVAALAAVRAARDAPLIMADCFTLTLRTGTVLTLTNADVPVTLGGTTFLANSILIDGLGFKCAIGLDVDEQQVTIAARPANTIGGGAGAGSDPPRRTRRLHRAARARLPDELERAAARLGGAVPGGA